MEIAFLLLGIFSLIDDPLFGLVLIGIVLLLWLIGLVWDKKQFGDWFYSWKQLRKLWDIGISEEKKQ